MKLIKPPEIDCRSTAVAYKRTMGKVGEELNMKGVKLK